LKHQFTKKIITAEKNEKLVGGKKKNSSCLGKKENNRKWCPIIKLFMLNKDLFLETSIYQKIITEEKK